MRRTLLATAALAAAVGAFTVASLPPVLLTLAADPSDGTVAGAFHVHTEASDGRGSADEVAAAAARAGLRFVVFTDHGDGTEAADPPAYRHGVLCIHGVEISTTGGHYIALDLPTAPYPLGGEARDVVADVRRLGGFGIVAHSDSPKPELRWRAWEAPFDAIEIINLDTAWRLNLQRPGWRPKLRLLQALTTYPFRPSESIAALLVEGVSPRAQAGQLARRRRVVMLAGADAHAKLALFDVEPGENRLSVPLPSYEAAFGTLSIRARPDQALSGDAMSDAALLMRALRGGAVYTAVDGLASPPHFEFTASNENGVVSQGGELEVGGAVTLRVRTNAPERFTTTIWQDDRVLTTRQGEPALEMTAPADPAVYRVEIHGPDRPNAPAWVVSNPIYVVGSAQPPGLPVRPPASESVSLFDEQDISAWTVETDPTSLAAVDLVQTQTGAELLLRFGLSGGPPDGQVAALAVFTSDGVAPYGRLTFRAHAQFPMRVSVQLRAAATPDLDERWQRSVYLDTADSEQTVYFDDLTPIGTTGVQRPPTNEVHSIVFAVDTTNTKPGSSGRVWISEVRLQQ